MVIKCDLCYFTEMKIYPGHGRRTVRKDGKLLAFLSRKAWSYTEQHLKAQRLTWTQAWRRKNKKGRVENLARKRVKKTATIYKAIQGLSIEDLRKRRAQKPEMRKVHTTGRT